MSNMVVNTNVLALNSHRALKSVGTMQSKSSARLSSGLRINSAADDAAGLSISEKMRAQIRGLDQASTNSQDAISLIQTAEGGMAEIDNMLQRVRELTVQVSNDTEEHNTLGTGDRQKVQDEIAQLVTEIDAMSERTEFNKKKVINGDYEDPNATFKTASANYEAAKAAKETSAAALLAAQKAYDDALNATGTKDIKALEESLATAKTNAMDNLKQFEAIKAAEKDEPGSLLATKVTAQTGTILSASTAAVASSLGTALGIASYSSDDLTALDMNGLISLLKNNKLTTSITSTAATSAEVAKTVNDYNKLVDKLDTSNSLEANMKIISALSSFVSDSGTTISAGASGLLDSLTSLNTLANQVQANQAVTDHTTIGSLKEALDKATGFADVAEKTLNDPTSGTRAELELAKAADNHAYSVLKGLASKTAYASIDLNGGTSLATAVTGLGAEIGSAQTTAMNTVLNTVTTASTSLTADLKKFAELKASDTTAQAALRRDFLDKYDGQDETLLALKDLVNASDTAVLTKETVSAATTANNNALSAYTTALTAKANLQIAYDADVKAYYADQEVTMADGTTKTFSGKVDFDAKYAAAQQAVADADQAITDFNNNVTLADMKAAIEPLQAAYDEAVAAVNTPYTGTAAKLTDATKAKDDAITAMKKIQDSSLINNLKSNGTTAMVAKLDGTKESLDAFLAEFSAGAKLSSKESEVTGFLGTGETVAARAANRRTYLENYDGEDATMLALKSLVEATDKALTLTDAHKTAFNENAAAQTKVNAATTALIDAQTLYDKAAADPLRQAADASMSTEAQAAAKQTLNAAQTSLDKATTADTKSQKNMDNFSSQMSRAQVKIDALNGKSAGLHFQVGANAGQSMEMSIGAIKSDILGIGDGDGNTTINVLEDSGRDITEILDTLDTALSYVTTERSRLGAAQNRLEYTINSLDTSSENLSAAESRIRDTDMAKEMMSLTKANVLQQAATSMLAQANQAPQNVLQLLG